MIRLIYKNFTPKEHDTWKALFERQRPLRDRQIDPLCSEGIRALNLTGEHIPNIDEVNSRLKALTGWEGVPVQGYEESASFFQMLSQRQFPIGNFIRDDKDLNYTPAPDVFHDLYGHLPFLANKEYADFCHEMGVRASKYYHVPKIIRQFDRLFWFGVEFPLIENKGLRQIFGAGIASSFTECAYSLSEKPKVYDFNIEVIRNLEFDIDRLQDKLFLLKDRKQLYSCLESFERPLRVNIAAGQ